jgi:hypothetical protein
MNESSRAQQAAMKEARAQHETVEERKNPAYLNLGRHLAVQGIAPPNAPHLLPEVQRRREAVDRHLQHTAELATLSSQIDKQELRKFYFTVFSVLILLAIIVPLVFSRLEARVVAATNDAILPQTERLERVTCRSAGARTKAPVGRRSVVTARQPAHTPTMDVARDTVRHAAMTTAKGNRP